MDHDLIKRNLEKADALIKEGGDWDRRNRFALAFFVRQCIFFPLTDGFFFLL